MVDVVNKRCGHEDCNKRLSYGKVGNKAERCSGHTGDGMVDVRNKTREMRPQQRLQQAPVVRQGREKQGGALR